jgi:tetratricopeptide (TPR) repeat protein
VFLYLLPPPFGWLVFGCAIFFMMRGWMAPTTYLAVGLAPILFVLSLLYSSWGNLAWARMWLAFKGRLPWRLVAFLSDAHKAGVLRTSGDDYQFRHTLLLDRFAWHGLDLPRPGIRGWGLAKSVAMQFNLAGSWSDSGRLDLARDWFEGILDLLDEKPWLVGWANRYRWTYFGSRDIRNDTLLMLGYVCARRGQYLALEDGRPDDALAEFRASRDYYAKAYPSLEFNFIWASWHSIVTLLIDIGHVDEAFEEYRANMHAFLGTRDKSHPIYGETEALLELLDSIPSGKSRSEHLLNVREQMLEMLRSHVDEDGGTDGRESLA